MLREQLLDLGEDLLLSLADEREVAIREVAARAGLGVLIAAVGPSVSFLMLTPTLAQLAQGTVALISPADPPQPP